MERLQSEDFGHENPQQTIGKAQCLRSRIHEDNYCEKEPPS